MPEGVFPKGFWFWPPILLVGLFLPFVFASDYFVSVAVLFGLYASINLMWMLVIGTAGIYSFATLAIVGVSAYVVSYFGGASQAGYDLTKPEWPIWLVLLVATAVGAVSGLVVAAPAIRLRGIYFALITIGLVELARTFVVQRTELGRALGLSGAKTFVPDDLLATEGARYISYYVAFTLVIVSLVVYWLVDGGRLGLLLRTARESEPVAHAFGVDVVRARLAVFLVSSAMLGLIGGAYVGFYGGISPQIFDFDTLLLLLGMMVVGGLGSAKGVLLGTALLLFIDQRFLEAGASRLIAIGFIMLLVTIFTKRGLVGIPGQLRAWMNEGDLGRKETAPAAADEIPAGSTMTKAP